ncbi:MAG: RimK family alpha-L-glutamate ligase, partial [Gammaproteobacteria bacterium]|nr:RimK family alpha-L-glutamate ligase [Gammaproteobacteria bacterium]
AFSKGVIKAENREALTESLNTLFKKSSLLLVQEYLYTEFDWRIGVLNNKPIFACRYYMVKNHWQIYQHTDNKSQSGGFDTLPTFEVPRRVLQAAIAATKPIGEGLYGVDVKEINGRGYVIEVNDNPSIDRGVEDKYLGDELYMHIMSEFLRRMQVKRGDIHA